MGPHYSCYHLAKPTWSGLIFRTGRFERLPGYVAIVKRIPWAGQNPSSNVDDMYYNEPTTAVNNDSHALDHRIPRPRVTHHATGYGTTPQTRYARASPEG